MLEQGKARIRDYLLHPSEIARPDSEVDVRQDPIGDVGVKGSRCDDPLHGDCVDALCGEEGEHFSRRLLGPKLN